MSKKYKFGIISHAIITDPELSLQAKAIYSMLCVYANKKRVCWPSRATLADIGGVSCRTVDRSIQELKNKNYIKREGRLLRLM
jgi:hypothetical protein